MRVAGDGIMIPSVEVEIFPLCMFVDVMAFTYGAFLSEREADQKSCCERAPAP